MEAFSTLVIAGGSVGTNSVGINSDVGKCLGVPQADNSQIKNKEKKKRAMVFKFTPF